ncbi:MAG: hypothetical protein R2708_28790 [Vicinamibacterales bacterium]
MCTWCTFGGGRGQAHAEALTALGHEAVHLLGVTGTPLMRALRAGTADVIVIDLLAPPAARPRGGDGPAVEPIAAAAARLHRRHASEAVARMRTPLPDAVYTTWGCIRSALAPRLLATAPQTPIVPPRPAVCRRRTLTQKLGIAARRAVAVIGALPGLAALLEPLPPEPG